MNYVRRVSRSTSISQSLTKAEWDPAANWIQELCQGLSALSRFFLYFSQYLKPTCRSSGSPWFLAEYGPQADPLVSGPGSQQAPPGVWVVREGHALHHICVVLQHRQRLQLLPPEYPHAVVPAGWGQELAVPSETQLGNAGVDQRHAVLELEKPRERILARPNTCT